MIENAIREICLSANDSNYEFLLEADLCGWLFHKIITQLDDYKKLHLDTKVNNSNDKYDIVIGEIQYPDNGRAFVNPITVAEVKIFPRVGFTSQQHNVHFHHIIDDDLRKLSNINNDVEKAVIIMDGFGYLNGRHQGVIRLDFLRNKRDEISNRIKIYLLKIDNARWIYEII